ncbi:MAG: hypothetical protein U5Q03_08995 [Bacteroidota bacterium]|nr:hypothetical protein [Bacteroidota bacterium]
MRTKIFKLCFTLLIVFSAFSSHSEVIVGISDPFPFGSVTPVPLSNLGFIIAALMIVFYSSWRFLRFRSKKTI